MRARERLERVEVRQPRLEVLCAIDKDYIAERTLLWLEEPRQWPRRAGARPRWLYCRLAAPPVVTVHAPLAVSCNRLV